MPDAQLGLGAAAEMGAQYLLEHGLWHLLAGLCEAVVALDGETEGTVKVGDAAPGERLAEGNTLRPLHLERCGGAQPLCDSPATQVFHGPDAGGLGPRAAMRHFRPRLDQDAPDPVQGQLRGSSEARRAASGDDHREGGAGRPLLVLMTASLALAPARQE